MLRWIVAFMEENEPRWNEMKSERDNDRRRREKEDEWSAKTREDKIREMEDEKKQRKGELKSNKELRYEEARRLKRSWTEWRGKNEEPQEVEENILSEEYLGELGQLCMRCVATPCVCLEVMIDKRIELLKLEEEITRLFVF